VRRGAGQAHQLGPGARQARHDGALGHLERRGDLAVGEPLELAQDEHRAVLAREARQEPLEREARLGARQRLLRRRAGVGRGLVGLRQRAHEPQALALQAMQAGVHGQAMEPGREARAPVEGVGALEELQEHVLGRVLGVGRTAEEPPAQALDALAMALVGRPQRAHVAAPEAEHELLVGVHRGRTTGRGPAGLGPAGAARHSMDVRNPGGTQPACLNRRPSSA